MAWLSRRRHSSLAPEYRAYGSVRSRRLASMNPAPSARSAVTFVSFSRRRARWAAMSRSRCRIFACGECSVSSEIDQVLLLSVERLQLLGELARGQPFGALEVVERLPHTGPHDLEELRREGEVPVDPRDSVLDAGGLRDSRRARHGSARSSPGAPCQSARYAVYSRQHETRGCVCLSTVAAKGATPGTDDRASDALRARPARPVAARASEP